MSCYLQEKLQKLNIQYRILLFISDKDGQEYENMILEHWKDFKIEKEYINFENSDYKKQKSISKYKKQIKKKSMSVEEIVISNRVNLRKLKVIFKPRYITDVEHGISDIMFWLRRLNLLKRINKFELIKFKQLWSIYRWPAQKHLTIMDRKVLDNKVFYYLDLELFKGKLSLYSKKYFTNHYDVVILIERLDLYGKENVQKYLEQILQVISMDLNSKNVKNASMLIKQRYGSGIKIKEYKDLIEKIFINNQIYFAIDLAPENIPAEYLLFENKVKFLYSVGFSTALNLQSLDMDFKNIMYVDSHLKMSYILSKDHKNIVVQIKENSLNQRILEIDSKLVQISESI
jgi:hypothetical protein